MIVYLVMEGFEYEGETVLRVFADRARAEQHRAMCEAEDTSRFHVYTVQEHKVVQ